MKPGTQRLSPEARVPVSEPVHAMTFSRDQQVHDVVESLRRLVSVTSTFPPNPSTSDSTQAAVRHDAKESPMPKLASILPEDAAERKTFPLFRGLFNYFPNALCAVAHLSWKGNQQHHPDKPLHWDQSKSTDELDALLRHIMDGDWDAVAWRALANLERELTNAHPED